MAADIVDFLAARAAGPIDRGWLRHRLTYGSFIWPAKRLLYLETPKVACSTIKWCLADLSGRAPEPRPWIRETSLAMAIHARSEHPLPSLTTVSFKIAKQALTSKTWTRVCVVRNPYARLYSAWAEKIRELSPRFRPLAWAIRDWDPGSAENGSVRFSAFLRYLIAAASDEVRADTHWSPMAQFLMPDLINYTHILRLEDFPGAFASIIARVAPDIDALALLARRRTNTSLPSDWRGGYDEASAADARALAADDFSLFGYDLDSWRTQASEPADRAWHDAVALSVVQSRNELIDALWSRIEALEQALSDARPASASP